MRKDLYEGKTPILPIPERRPAEKQARAYVVTAHVVPQAATGETSVTKITAQPAILKKKLWHCKQCGYVVFREDPPYVCPICKAKREIFAEIEITAIG
jgi:rubrerythrin